MLRIVAVVFGLALIALGAMGFVEMLTPEGNLFGVFRVDMTVNIFHLVTGFIALIVGLVSEDKSALLFQVYGIIYGLLALLGFNYVDENIFGLIAHNMADFWLHLSIAAISLYLGFLYTD